MRYSPVVGMRHWTTPVSMVMAAAVWSDVYVGSSCRCWWMRASVRLPAAQGPA